MRPFAQRAAEAESKPSSQQLATPERETEMLVAAEQKIRHSSAPTLGQIVDLQTELEKFPQVELPVEHNFAPSLYIRTLRIPKGTILVGEMHAKEHIFILTQGEMIIYTEDGQINVKAPYQVVCRAGLKRVGKAITDVIGSNIHITELRDLVAIRNEFIATPALEDKSCG